MSEIKTSVYEAEDKDGEQIFIITKDHTIADIYRLCVYQEWFDEMISLHELESEK